MDAPRRSAIEANSKGGGNRDTFKEVNNFKRKRDIQEPVQQLKTSYNYLHAIAPDTSNRYPTYNPSATLQYQPLLQSNQQYLMSNTVRRVHLTDPAASYGIQFIEKPTQEEISTVRRTLVEQSKEFSKVKDYNADSPSLLKALQSQDADEWTAAINLEYATLGIEKTWEAVLSIPDGKSWIPSHMVLVRQRYADGSIKKYKARLVANGNRQQLHTYNETSSPTAREASVKLFYAKAASLGRLVRTFDVKAAYLKSDLDEEIYMMLPKQNKNDKCEFVKLLKSIYGLKQAGKLWFENIRGVLLQNGYSQAPGDECVFTKYIPEEDIDIDICLYVDDLLVSSTSAETTNKLWNELKLAYGDVNETTHTETHLGIKWELLPSKDIKISQPGYIKKIVEELGMTDCSPEDTPYRSNKEFDSLIPLHTPEHSSLLHKMVGLLNHAATHTRPDILFITGILATKMITATDNDIKDAKHVVCYLLSTPTLGLTFKRGVGHQLVSFLDASHLYHDDSKGHSGLCYRLGYQRSACFAFSSKKQSLVTRSSSESEIYVIDKGCHDIEWLRQLLIFLRCPQDGPTLVHEDNASTIFLACSTAKWSDKSKHIKWRYFYALQAIKEGTAKLQHISTDEQIADIFTKEICVKKKFYHLRSLLLNCRDSRSGI
jgi:hypothetical protein